MTLQEEKKLFTLFKFNNIFCFLIASRNCFYCFYLFCAIVSVSFDVPYAQFHTFRMTSFSEHYFEWCKKSFKEKGKHNLRIKLFVFIIDMFHTFFVILNINMELNSSKWFWNFIISAWSMFWNETMLQCRKIMKYGNSFG